MYNIVNIQNLKENKFGKILELIKEKKKEQVHRKCHFYDEAKTLIILSKMLGGLPISFNESGKLEFKITSKLTIYSISVIILISVTAGVILNLHIHNLSTLDISFDDKIIFYGAVLYLGIYFLPIISFIEGKKIAEYFSSWIDFEEKYYKVTKKFLNYKMKNLQYLIFFIMFLDSILFLYFIYMLTTNHEEKYNFNYSKTEYAFIVITYLYFLWVIQSCLATWYFLTLGIRKTAKILLNDLQDSRLRNLAFDELYELWLDLKNLTEDLGTVFSWTYLFDIAYMFMMMMGTSYSLFASLVSPGGEMKYGYLTSTLISSFAFGLIADCAHRTTAEVGDEFKNSLLILLSNERDPIMRREMKWFIQTMSLNPPDITLSGYVTLNRSFNVSMLGTLVTYIVVVLQFRSTSYEESTPQP